MSDLDNMVDTEKETLKPVEVVVTNTEENIPPQDNNTDDVEFYVETEGDQEQPKNNMSQEQAYAAFRKEQDKRKRKQQEIDAKDNEINDLRSQVTRLSETVGGITKGAVPTLESCDYDEEAYSNKMKEYYAPKKAKPEEQKQTANPNQQANDAADFYLYQKEEELAKSLPDYAQNKAELIEKMKQYGGNESTMTHLASIAQQAGVDIAKATFAMNKSPKLLFDLNQAATTGNQFAIAEVLKKASENVKTRQRKPVDSKPDPSINSSGPIDNSEAQVKKAREAWVSASPNEKLKKWKDYQAVQKKVNK